MCPKDLYRDDAEANYAAQLQECLKIMDIDIDIGIQFRNDQ